MRHADGTYSGDGIRPRGPGRWEIRISVGKDPVTGKYRELSRTLKGSRRDALAARARILADYQPDHEDATTLTVADLLQRWTAHNAARWEPKTAYDYARKIEARILPALGPIRLCDLTTWKLDAVYQAWAADGLAPSSVRRYHAGISSALHQAVAWGWIARSPAEHATLPKMTRRRRVSLEAVDLARAIAAARELDGQAGALILVAATTGMRRAELAGMRWDTIDLDRRQLLVCRSVVDVSGRAVIQDRTKTDTDRTIDLADITVKALRWWRDEADRIAIALDQPGAGPWVWSSSLGATPMMPALITKTWATVRKAAGLPSSTRLHDLRHAYASLLLADGHTVTTVSELLGHSSANVTLAVYAHALPSGRRGAADRIGQLVAGGS